MKFGKRKTIVELYDSPVPSCTVRLKVIWDSSYDTNGYEARLHR